MMRMSYNKTNWHDGDIISQEKLNNIEQGIENLDTQYKDIAKKTITNDERNKLNSLENYDDSEIQNDLQVQKTRIENLDIECKDKANKYCVNVCDFGCVGDGITDDTDNLQSAIDYAISNNLNIISPKNKVYAISKPISLLNSNNILHLDFNKSIIKAISDMDYVLNYNCVDGTNDGGTIQNLYVDANEKANDCIRFEYTRKTRVYNCILKNAKEKFVNIVGGNIIVYGLYLDKRLYNYPNTIGI